MPVTNGEKRINPSSNTNNMWFWNKKKDKKKNPVVISDSCFTRLPLTHRHCFSLVSQLHSHPTVVVTHEVVHHDDSGSNFGLSMLAAMETDNAGMGYLAGGDLGGAMLGEALADHHHESSSDFGGFGDGDTGGGGSGGDYSSTSSDSGFSSSDSGGGSSDSGF